MRLTLEMSLGSSHGDDIPAECERSLSGDVSILQEGIGEVSCRCTYIKCTVLMQKQQGAVCVLFCLPCSPKRIRVRELGRDQRRKGRSR